MRGTGAEKCSANVANVLFLSFFFLGSLTTFAVCVCVGKCLVKTVLFFFSSLQVKRQRKGGEKRGKSGGFPAHLSWIPPDSREQTNQQTDSRRAQTRERERNEALLADHRLVSCSSRSRWVAIYRHLLLFVPSAAISKWTGQGVRFHRRDRVEKEKRIPKYEWGWRRVIWWKSEKINMIRKTPIILRWGVSILLTAVRSFVREKLSPTTVHIGSSGPL